MSKPAQPSKNLIITEGKDDVYVFHHLLAHYGIPKGIIEFKDFEGIEPLLEVLPIQLRESELERLGIVVDADTDLENRWKAVCYRLSKAGYSNVPAIPANEGTIIQEKDLPIVGVWVMPNNQLPGILEDFIGFLVPQEDLLWARAGECLKGIPPEQRSFPDARHSKAHIHTWLAWQEEPGTPLGLAITKRYLDADALHAKHLMNWVKRLFDLNESGEV